MEVLKVSTKSNPNSVAGALAAIIRNKKIIFSLKSILVLKFFKRKYIM